MATAKKTGPGAGSAGASRAPAKKPGAASRVGTPEDLAPAAEGAGRADMKLRGLLDQVAAATGTKKAQARAVTEAVLKALGDALAAGQVLNLPGLGKARVVRGDGMAGTMTIKLRRTAPGAKKAAAPEGAEALAEPGEAG